MRRFMQGLADRTTGTDQIFVPSPILGQLLCPENDRRIGIVLSSAGGGTLFVGINPNPRTNEGITLTTAIGYIALSDDEFGDAVGKAWFANPSGVVAGATVIQVFGIPLHESSLYERHESSQSLNPDNGFLAGLRKPASCWANLISSPRKPIHDTNRWRASGIRRGIHDASRDTGEGFRRDFRLKYKG